MRIHPYAIYYQGNEYSYYHAKNHKTAVSDWLGFWATPLYPIEAVPNDYDVKVAGARTKRYYKLIPVGARYACAIRWNTNTPCVTTGLPSEAYIPDELGSDIKAIKAYFDRVYHVEPCAFHVSIAKKCLPPKMRVSALMPVLGFNTGQWWVYDDSRDVYIDPPADVLEQVCTLPEEDQEDALDQIIQTCPTWLQQTCYWVDGEVDI